MQSSVDVDIFGFILFFRDGFFDQYQYQECSVTLISKHLASRGLCSLKFPSINCFFFILHIGMGPDQQTNTGMVIPHITVTFHPQQCVKSESLGELGQQCYFPVLQP